MEQILDENQIQETNFTYASVGRRFAAILIDGIILAVVRIVINFSFLGYFWSPNPENLSGFNNLPSSSLVYSILGLHYLTHLLYESIMISSNKKATIGKMAMGIVVVDADGNKLSFGRAIGRWFSKIVSALIFFIGFIMAFFDDKKRALHDKMVGSIVIKE